MDKTIQSQNCRSRRSRVLMAAILRTDDGDHPVRLRNLSENGALVEAETLPVVGSAVRFRKGELNLAARVAWIEDGRAGVAFDLCSIPNWSCGTSRSRKRRASSTFVGRPSSRNSSAQGSGKLQKTGFSGRLHLVSPIKNSKFSDFRSRRSALIAHCLQPVDQFCQRQKAVERHTDETVLAPASCRGLRL